MISSKKFLPKEARLKKIKSVGFAFLNFGVKKVHSDFLKSKAEKGAEIPLFVSLGEASGVFGQNGFPLRSVESFRHFSKGTRPSFPEFSKSGSWAEPVFIQPHWIHASDILQRIRKDGKCRHDVLQAWQSSDHAQKRLREWAKFWPAKKL